LALFESLIEALLIIYHKTKCAFLYVRLQKSFQNLNLKEANFVVLLDIL